LQLPNQPTEDHSANSSKKIDDPLPTWNGVDPVCQHEDNKDVSNLFVRDNYLLDAVPSGLSRHLLPLPYWSETDVEAFFGRKKVESGERKWKRIAKFAPVEYVFFRLNLNYWALRNPLAPSELLDVILKLGEETT
jgi:hypothetical protein